MPKRYNVLTKQANKIQNFHKKATSLEVTFPISRCARRVNKGAISSLVKLAIPQPIRVIRKSSSGCCWAYAMNSSTYGRMVSTYRTNCPCKNEFVP